MKMKLLSFESLESSDNEEKLQEQICKDKTVNTVFLPDKNRDLMIKEMKIKYKEEFLKE